MESLQSVIYKLKEKNKSLDVNLDCAVKYFDASILLQELETNHYEAGEELSILERELLATERRMAYLQQTFEEDAENHSIVEIVLSEDLLTMIAHYLELWNECFERINGVHRNKYRYQTTFNSTTNQKKRVKEVPYYFTLTSLWPYPRN